MVTALFPAAFPGLGSAGGGLCHTGPAASAVDEKQSGRLLLGALGHDHTHRGPSASRPAASEQQRSLQAGNLAQGSICGRLHPWVYTNK